MSRMTFSVLEDRAGLLVDEARDTFHTATASETVDGGLVDALDVVLTMILSFHSRIYLQTQHV